MRGLDRPCGPALLTRAAVPGQAQNPSFRQHRLRGEARGPAPATPTLQGWSLSRAVLALVGLPES